MDMLGLTFDIGGLVGGVLDIFFYILIFAIMGAIILFVFQYASYNITFVVRSLAKNRKIIKVTKAKQIVTKEGLTYLKVRGKDYKGAHADVPPAEAIELTTKGKKYVEAYFTPNREFIYITDTNEKIPSFQPLTSSQRVSAVNQLFKARQDGGFNWAENVPLIAGGMILIVLMALLIISWEEVWKPMEKMGNKLEGMMEKADQILQRVQAIDSGAQIVNSEPVDPNPGGG